MLSQEMAAIVYMVRNLNLGAAEYFREVPENIRTPAVYFPNPEISAGQDTFTSYKNTYTLYMQVIGKDTEQSCELAGKIVEEVQKKERRIEMYDETGTVTEHVCVIKNMDAKVIDTGVTQIKLVWDTRKNRELPKKIQEFDVSIRKKGE